MKDPELLRLGNIIRAARKNKGLTQLELSDQTGIGIKTIGNIESGLSNPTFLTLYPIIDRLDIPGNILFNQESLTNEELSQLIRPDLTTCTPKQKKALLKAMDIIADVIRSLKQEFASEL